MSLTKLQLVEDEMVKIVNLTSFLHYKLGNILYTGTFSYMYTGIYLYIYEYILTNAIIFTI